MKEREQAVREQEEQDAKAGRIRHKKHEHHVAERHSGKKEEEGKDKK